MPYIMITTFIYRIKVLLINDWFISYMTKKNLVEERNNGQESIKEYHKELEKALGGKFGYKEVTQ